VQGEYTRIEKLVSGEWIDYYKGDEQSIKDICIWLYDSQWQIGLCENRNYDGLSFLDSSDSVCPSGADNWKKHNTGSKVNLKVHNMDAISKESNCEKIESPALTVGECTCDKPNDSDDNGWT